jgi:hypothetical protein
MGASIRNKNSILNGSRQVKLPAALALMLISISQPGNQVALAQQADTYSPPVLHGLDQNNSASVTEPAQSASGSAPATSPVEAFFQLAPTAPANPAPATKAHSGTHKALWHVMDNIGVPMFGNKDADIDPALSRPFVMPPLAPDKNANDANAATNGQIKPAKPTIIDPQAAAQDPAQMAPDDTTSKASTVNHPISNPQ